MVIVIIAILAGMILPASKGSKDKAQLSSCLSNLRQINLQLTSYEIDNAGVFPYAVNDPHWGDATGWMKLISTLPLPKDFKKMKMFTCELPMWTYNPKIPADPMAAFYMRYSFSFK